MASAAGYLDRARARARGTSDDEPAARTVAPSHRRTVAPRVFSMRAKFKSFTRGTSALSRAAAVHAQPSTARQLFAAATNAFAEREESSPRCNVQRGGSTTFLAMSIAYQSLVHRRHERRLLRASRRMLLRTLNFARR